MIRRNIEDEKLLRRIEFRFIQQEIKDLDQYRKLCLTQQQRSKLRKVVGIQSRSLEDRLYQEGFNDDTVMALELFPIAKTAWASGRVTLTEKNEVWRILQDYHRSDSRQALALLDQWLKKEPSNCLWSLWEQFTVVRASASEEFAVGESTKLIYLACVKVAQASGGIFGMGSICPAEKHVLKKVRGVLNRIDPQKSIR